MNPATPWIYAPQAFVILNSNLWQQTITLNTWHHIRVTVGSTVSGQNQTIVYVDGMAQTTNSTPAPNNNTTENWILHIGDFDGDLDEVRISNTVR